MKKKLPVLVGLLCLAAANSNSLAACWPLETPEETKFGEIPASVSTRYSHYVTWGCLAPTRAYSAVYLSSPYEITTALMKAGRSQAEADVYLVANQPIPNTPAELEFIRQIAVQVGPKVVTTSERPTYAILDNGLRNTTASGKRVPANTNCNPNVRILNSNYYSVEGEKATDGTVLGKVAAICKISSLSGLNKVGN